jgi:regulator of protease activity HflC (stomatin/prohibitin superfamily)
MHSQTVNAPTKSSIAIAAVAAVFILGWLSFYSVGPGERGVLMTWGKIVPGVVMPGAHFKIPFVQTAAKFDIRVQKYENTEAAASKDLQDVHTNVAVNLHLDAGKVDKLYENVGNIDQVEAKLLRPIVSNSLKAVIAKYNAEDLVEHRDDVRQGVGAAIRREMKPYPVEIDAVNLTNFQFSGDYANAIEAKQVAQQKALQAKYDLQKAKTDAQQQVVKAQARAQATLINAKADAQALEMKRKAVTPELIMLDAVNKWNGKMPATLVTDGKMLPTFDTSRKLTADR